MSATTTSTPILIAMQHTLQAYNGNVRPPVHNVRQTFPHPTSHYATLTIGGRDFPTLHILQSILHYSYDTTSVATSLAGHLRQDQMARVSLMDVFQFTSSTPPFSVVPAGGFSWDWDIISSRLFDDDDFMKSIAAWVTPFCRDLILPFFSNMGPSATPRPASRSNDPDPSRREQQTLRENLFRRDGHVCAITGQYNRYRPAFLIAPVGTAAEPFEAAHILPFCSSGSADMRSLIEMFTGGVILSQEVNKMINDPSNAMIIAQSAHTAFDAFDWSIEATVAPTATEYRLRIYSPSGLPLSMQHLQDGQLINFGPHDPTGSISLPSSVYLNVHNALARVLHASRAADIFAEVVNEQGMLKEKATDGSNWGAAGQLYLHRQISQLS